MQVYLIRYRFWHANTPLNRVAARWKIARQVANNDDVLTSWCIDMHNHDNRTIHHASWWCRGNSTVHDELTDSYVCHIYTCAYYESACAGYISLSRHVHSIAKVCVGRMAWWHIYIYMHPKPEVQLTQHLDDENHRGKSRWTLWKSNRRGYALATSTKSSEPLYGALKQVLGDKMLIRSGYMPSSILKRKPTEVSDLPYGALMQELEKQILLMRMGNTSYCI